MKLKMHLLKKLFYCLCCLAAAPYTMAQSQIGTALNGEAEENQFGRAVAISGDAKTVAVGGPYNAENGLNSGHARVFRFQQGNWAQQGDDLDGDTTTTQFGWSVALDSSGNTLAVASHYSGFFGHPTGYIRAYQWDGINWTQLGDDIMDVAQFNGLNSTIELSASGTQLVIGNPSATDWVTPNVGRVHVKNWDGVSWAPLGGDFVGAGNWKIGSAVDISANGNTICFSTQSDTGRAEVHQWDGSSWAQKGGELVTDPPLEFVRTVNLGAHGNRIAVAGTPFSPAAAAGNVICIFEWDGAHWQQMQGVLTAEEPDDGFGLAQEMSADGNWLVAGAWGNDGAGTTAGNARVFHYQNATWQQQGADIDGVGIDDQSGIAVGIDYGGKAVIVGANKNDGSANNAGHARVFCLSDSACSEISSVPQLITADAKVYPNPTQGEVTVALEQTVPGAVLRLFDVCGQLQWSQTLPETQHKTLVLPPASGLYLLQIDLSSGKSRTIPIVKH